MIRETEVKVVETKEVNGVLTSIKAASLFGTSTDTKPTAGYANGSTFVEVDTGDIYLFNESTTSWVKQFSLQE